MDTAHNKAVVALCDDLGNGGCDLADLDRLWHTGLGEPCARRWAHPRAGRNP